MITSFFLEVISASKPPGLNLMGIFPSSTQVFAPVGVQKAGIPAPPALHFSARVPQGVSSTSSSPARYCFVRFSFSPTQLEIIFLICLFSSKSPRPQSTTPQLFEAIVRFLVPYSFKAVMSPFGVPPTPNPPTIKKLPSFTSLTASRSELQTLFEKLLLPKIFTTFRQKSPDNIVLYFFIRRKIQF